MRDLSFQWSAFSGQPEVSENARMLLPLGMTDREFDAIMQTFYAIVLDRMRAAVAEMEVELGRWADDGGAC